MTKQEADRLVSINAHLYSTNRTNYAPGSHSPLQRYKSTNLLNGRNEIVIVHKGEDYRLRHTRKGKLILTK